MALRGTNTVVCGSEGHKNGSKEVPSIVWVHGGGCTVKANGFKTETENLRQLSTHP